MWFAKDNQMNVFIRSVANNVQIVTGILISSEGHGKCCSLTADVQSVSDLKVS